MVITSPPVTLTNLGAQIANNVRVTVVSAASGAPIAGAVVELIHAAGNHSLTTDATGVVSFPGVSSTGGYSVTAAQSAYDFVSVLGLEGADVLIPLPPVTKPTLVGGIKGTTDLSHVSSMGNISLSLSGASVASPIVAFSPGPALFGGDIFQVAIPGMSTKVPVPAGATLSVMFSGADIPLKETYYARATSGVRAAWSFGGHLDLGMLMTGGGLSGNLVGTILPYLQRFDHGVRPVVDVMALGTVVDTGDINGNGNTTELVPDYNNFPNVALTPNTAQALRYQLMVHALPMVSGGMANALIVVAGTLLPGVGFVPLGLDGQQATMAGSIVSSFTTKVAPPHGGLETGQYVVLATAVRLAMGLPGPGSARLFVGSRLPTSIDFSDHWLDSPVGSTWHSMTREVTVPSIAAADFYRVSFASADGAWNIYSMAATGAQGTLTIPAAPMGLVDRTLNATVSVDAVELGAGATTASLFDVTAGGSIALDHATKSFARAIASH
jgi:hypothetical protein